MDESDLNPPAPKVSEIEGLCVPVTFENWVGNRSVPVLGTNAGAPVLAFQNWRRFKESFAPELIRRAVDESSLTVRSCIDPFGGSGTTALASQFLGVRPSTIEVNPYLADLIEAKLATYDVGSLSGDFASVIRAVDDLTLWHPELFGEAPKTLVEPGVNDRWVFGRDLAARIGAYNAAFSLLDNSVNARLFRVLLGGILVDLSNVVVSGKGRRYRSDWARRRAQTGADLDRALLTSVECAIGDIVRHAERKELGYTLLRGDSRVLLDRLDTTDLVLFSPPYPNSFDYTDVYNVELWALGYLKKSSDNRDLRLSTLSSHIQIKRTYESAPTTSPTLADTLAKLQDQRNNLWDERLIDMIGGYFSDMQDIMKSSLQRLNPGGEMWMVVGDSKYADVPVPVAAILEELAADMGCEVILREPMRSMRASAQQGGQRELAETLVVISAH